MRFAFIPDIQMIARKAGAAILDIYQRGDNFGVQHKADASPLTIADQAANKIICDGLEQLAIQYPILSEENKAIPYEERKSYDYFWLVDPLDGTKEFIKRNGEFTVNIALIHQQKPVFGVVYVPVTDVLYWAQKGEGAFMQKEGKEIALNASTFQTKQSALRIVCSRSHLNAATEAYVQQFQEHELVPQGSSLKFMIIAEGNAHIYPRLAPTMEWDTGAAQIVVEEAGGMVLQAHSPQALLYNKPDLRNPSFIAFGKLDRMEKAPLLH